MTSPRIPGKTWCIRMSTDTSFYRWSEEDGKSLARATAVLQAVELHPSEVTGFEIWLASQIYDESIHGKI